MKSKGFTLIELVVVIVILGILAATAVPKFINLQRDARIASLDGFVGALKAANSIVMSKATIVGIKSAKVETNIPNTDLYVLDGHMSIKPEHIKAAMNIEGFMVTNYALTMTRTTFVYLADKELTMPELRALNCFIHLTRSYTQQDGSNVIDTGDLKVNEFYDGC
ncbi:MAG: prepilin-type N-terminal cleavage/methylation domain-containing protein [Moritella sp.]|uniref:prepilin-type N-terminal cleavage/methylation domain-containing protein n=1 Tax=Moritella sp. TaxID=78556 RepID=UPI0029AA432B|nr:prepilin-type N-terminal cleavage/methylation domain-containing protein [Moritella sp.]MDX2321501.1 prepilin-type N-terminal cleavage/methylation domain-containing protein [Moritella sp.]